MPPQEQWESLFDVGLNLERFALAGDIAELGCGYGTFTLPLARRTNGRVHAIDIDPAAHMALLDPEGSNSSLGQILKKTAAHCQESGCAAVLRR